MSYKLASASHRTYVTRLYRRSLKLASDWYWQREEFREKALVIRKLFDMKKNVNNPKEVQLLLLECEQILSENFHPQPYISPTAPDGSKWERNVPFPEELVKRGMTPFDNCS